MILAWIVGDIVTKCIRSHFEKFPHQVQILDTSLTNTLKIYPRTQEVSMKGEG